MNIIRNIMNAIGIARRSSLAQPTPDLLESLGASPTGSGAVVTECNAQTIAAVWACVSYVSESIGSLPLHLYKTTPNGKDVARTEQLYRILHDAPNTEQTAVAYRAAAMIHLLLWGNSYSEIVRDGAGRVAELHLVPPQWMSVERDDGGRLVYVVQKSGGVKRPLAPDRILHVAGPSPDGIVGWSVIRQARESLGLTKAAEEFGASFFGNGARPSGVLQHPAKLSDQAVPRLRAQFAERYAGPKNTGKPMILEEGMTWANNSIPPEDAQFLQTRQFQTLEVCRWFRVPPHKIFDLSGSKYANIEQQNVDALTDCLRPWLVRWEQEIQRKLLPPNSEMFARHAVEGILRGDTQSRYQAYAAGRQWGFLSVNDIRELENLNRVDGGDVYLQPVNMVDAANPNPPQPGATQ